MKIHNVRLGFATNSSSMHSLLFMQHGREESDNDANGNFFRNKFTCATHSAKALYLGAQVYDALCRVATPEIAQEVTELLIGQPYSGDASVDHQSQVTFPHDWDGHGLDMRFLTEFRDMLFREDVVVLGGDDGDDKLHRLHGTGLRDARLGGYDEGFPGDGRMSGSVARKDSRGFWTMFDRRRGTKLRLSLNEMDPTPEKSDAPELVDVKITDYCPYGCEFCYQGSTEKGEHASVNALDRLAQAFRELRVFEVALGGGEPTLHPAFPLIVQQFHRRGVRVNITTKNTRWVLQNDDLLDKLGAVGFSVDTAEQVRAFGEKKLSKPGRMPVERLRDKVMVQHVVGVDEDEAAFADLLDACAEYGIRLTLLGYKTTGRGMSFRPTEVPRWAQLVVEKMKQHERKFWVGIDTVLVKQGKQALLDAGISEWCMTEHEGAFSCYVDAVKGRIGPSSFCGEKEYRPLSEAMGAQEVMDAFAGF